ncbi:VOC family protein [Salinactinospora qingdaonensis]|uniref:VOC domain-containing protein n=1 Tax=Salinactinospora qingdaonensis TaxID=702744 RepID=A0ABP7GI40_9ACTN
MFSGIGRVTVLVDDLDAALRFYRDVLGFVVLHDSTQAGFRYLHVGVAGQPGVGVWLLPAESGEIGRQTGDAPMLVLYTDDLGPVVAALEKAEVPMWDYRGDEASESLHFRDPFGNVLIAARLLG